jgi:hypothetical protein
VTALLADYGRSVGERQRSQVAIAEAVDDELG